MYRRGRVTQFEVTDPEAERFRQPHPRTYQSQDERHHLLVWSPVREQAPNGVQGQGQLVHSLISTVTVSLGSISTAGLWLLPTVVERRRALWCGGPTCHLSPSLL